MAVDMINTSSTMFEQQPERHGDSSSASRTRERHRLGVDDDARGTHHAPITEVRTLACQIDDKPSDDIIRYLFIADLAGTVTVFANVKEDIDEVGRSPSHSRQSPQPNSAFLVNAIHPQHPPRLKDTSTTTGSDSSTVAQTNTHQSTPRSPTPERRYSLASTH